MKKKQNKIGHDTKQKYKTHNQHNTTKHLYKQNNNI